MEPFTFERAGTTGRAIHAAATRQAAMYIAGGTELVNWLKEGIARPAHLIDINALPLAHISAGRDGLRIGALARMSDVAAHETVRRDYPAIAESLELSA